MENVCWKEFGLLCFVWVAFLALQIGKVFISYRFGFVSIYRSDTVEFYHFFFFALVLILKLTGRVRLE